MQFTIENVVVVPYGVERWTAEDMTVRGIGDHGLTVECGFPCAVVADMDRGLRLNSAVIDVPAGGGDDFTAVAGWTAGLCGVWDMAARGAVALYFRGVEEAVEARRDELTRRLTRYEGLFAYSDFRFSAPRSLPRAHLFAPAAGGRTGTADDFVRVDLAFFPGKGRVAASLCRATASGRRWRDRIERLVAAGVEVSWLEDLSTAASFGHVLSPAPDASFLDGESMPCGLLRPQALS